MRIQILLAGMLLMFGLSAFAGQARTTYRISNSGTIVTTAVTNPSDAQAKVLERYLFDVLAENLTALPGVKSVELQPGAKRVQTIEDQEDSTEYTRRYPVQVKLEMPEKATLTFTVEENFRKCKAGYACSPSAFMKVTSGLQQDISIEVQRQGQGLLSVVSQYNLNSVILGAKAGHERNTIMLAATRALRANNEKMVQ